MRDQPRLQLTLCGAMLVGALVVSGCSRGVSFRFSSGGISTGGYRFDFQGEKATRNENGIIEADVTSLVIENRFGDVRVTATENDAKWQWDLTCWADDPHVATRFTEQVKLETATESGRRSWRLILPEPPVDDLRGVKSDLTLFVPEAVRVELINEHGETKVEGIALGTKARCRHGKLELLNLEGELDASTEHGQLFAEDIPGGILSNRHGKISANHVNGDLQVTTAHGALTLADVDGSVQATNAHGDISATDIQGKLQAKNEHGAIAVANIENRVELQASHDPLSVENVIRDVHLRNRHGSVTVFNVSGKLDVQSSFGKIDLETWSDEIVCRNEHGKIRIIVKNRAFRVVRSETTFADMEVQIPASASPTIEAGTEHGEVDSDFPVLRLNEDVDNFQGLDRSPARVTLRNRHGDIRIKKVSTSADSK